MQDVKKGCSVEECSRGHLRTFDGKTYCSGHHKHMVKYGCIQSMQCVLECGRDRDGKSQVCYTCRNELLERQLKWCNVHGIQSIDLFNVNGKCKFCMRKTVADWHEAKSPRQKCAMDCGRNRRGTSDICKECRSSLLEQGLSHCKVHGVQKLNFFLESSGQCRECANINHKKRNKNTRSSIVEPLLIVQHSECAICKNAISRKSAKIDHDHEHDCNKGNGCINCRRALLCNRCNGMLGYYCDDPVILRRLIGKSSGYSDEVLAAGARYLDVWHREMIARGVRKELNIIDDCINTLSHILSYMA